ELSEQIQPEVGQDGGGETEQDEGGECETRPRADRAGPGENGHQTRLLVLTANRPCGRTCRNTTMITKTITFAIDAVVEYSMNELSSPSATAAMTAPSIRPRPPMTTTRNASI